MRHIPSSFVLLGPPASDAVRSPGAAAVFQRTQPEREEALHTQNATGERPLTASLACLEFWPFHANARAEADLLAELVDQVLRGQRQGQEAHQEAVQSRLPPRYNPCVRLRFGACILIGACLPSCVTAGQVREQVQRDFGCPAEQVRVALDEWHLTSHWVYQVEGCGEHRYACWPWASGNGQRCNLYDTE
jgi:hypothetical protein